jgi:hypothetical protein
VSSRLTSLGDRQVVALLDEATPTGVGIGGTTASLTVDGVPVFVKKVPLTDLERHPPHAGSTANLFRLPTFYQYGIGSAGFGAWREVAAHAMTTDWVLENRFQGFPILYHRRVLPQPSAPMEPAELERWVARWDGSPAVRARLTAIGEASASVVLFLEHIPHTLHTWLAAQTAAGDRAAASAYDLADRDMLAGVTFMQSQGLLHFDAHSNNLLTDGHRLYFADFGLATCTRFDLGAVESAFLRRHTSYDRCYTSAHLAQWLVHNLLQIPWPECGGYIRDNADGFAALPASAASIVARHARIAIVMDEFYGRLQNTSKSTPYPAEELRRVLDG